MNDLLLAAMAEKGFVSFYPEGSGQWYCRWEITLAHHNGRNITIAQGMTPARALEEAHKRAIANGFSEALMPRVITRVLNDGISTKDGCA